MTDISRDKIDLPDEEIEDMFLNFAGIGLTVEDLSFGPASEIDAFRVARRGWNKPGRVEWDDDDGLMVEDAAAMRGQSRRTVVLLRVGDYCAILGMDR